MARSRSDDAHDGWILGDSVGSPDVDQPCVVRLLGDAIEIDVRPQTLLPEPERITAPFVRTMVGSRRFGRSTRLAVAFDTGGIERVEDLRFLGVDIAGRSGRKFVERVVSAAIAGGARPGA